MSAPLLLLFTSPDQRTGALVDEGQAQALRAHIASLPAGSVWRDRFYVGAERQTEHGALDAVQRGEELILLAVGPEGGAALARWVAEHGLDGVAGVGLAGVTAPWAERIHHTMCSSRRVAQGQRLPGVCDCATHRLPLGPIEPLRAVAEMARRGEPCADCDGHGYYRGLDNTCDECGGHGREYPIRLIIACAPDDGVCAWCNGRAIVSINALWGGGGRRDVICHACTNGRALSSSDVARELISDADGQFGAHGDPLESYEWVSGGAIVICYERRAALDEHGLRAVVERLVR